MWIRTVLLALFALLPWQAGAQTIAPTALGTAACQIDPGQSGDAARALCVWTVANGSVEPGEGTGPLGGWRASDFGYRSGAVLFVVGNMVAFSFPIWAFLGADPITITGVIIFGELIELAGIYLLGEEALHAIHDRLMQGVNGLRGELRRWRETALERWMPVTFERWY